MCTCIQSFDSVIPYLENYRIIGHEQSSVFEYVNFLTEFSSSLQDLHFHQVMAIMLQFHH